MVLTSRTLAVSSLRESGTATAASAGTVMCSDHAPGAGKTATRSPTRSAGTEGPIAVTTPAASVPSLRPADPSGRPVSVATRSPRWTGEMLTRTWISPVRGAGASGRSSMCATAAASPAR
ncbi:hypothetical protein GCM10010140_49990 [Streptosporangium pseudovulgare]|uniref:Secreted protein n=1 Tax=Streptosporangium pseudovulgare TaxID=35765 RepID=A0ABQ2R6S5_9ACTN|nr:hypothetical protein GCM10010140_49990 [Streptosporangium pseudovulgare]